MRKVVDLQIDYSIDTSAGRFGAGLLATFLIDLTSISATGEEVSFVGNYDQAIGAQPGVNPDFKINWSLGMDVANAGCRLELSLHTRLRGVRGHLSPERTRRTAGTRREF